MVALCRDVFVSKLRKFRLSFAVFQYSNPYFPYVFHYPLQIFHICEKNSQDCGSSLYFYFYLLLFFLIFVCIKGHPTSDSGPSKEISWKESKLKTMKRPKCQRWRRAGKQEIAWASCVRVVFISRIFIHTVRKGNFATQDWAEVGTTKWRAFV